MTMVTSTDLSSHLGRRITAPLAAAFLLVVATNVSAGPHVFWQHQFSYPSQLNRTIAVTTDASDDFIVTSRNAYVETEWGGGWPYEYFVFHGSRIRKHDRGGRFLWERVLTSNGDVFGSSIASDAFANVFNCGSFHGRVDFGGGVLDSVAANTGYVVKYDPAGAFQWRRVFSGSGTSLAAAVTADDDGSLVVIGSFSGTVDFGGGPITSAGGDDVVMVRFDANGAHQWTRQFGDDQVQTGVDIAIDANHRIVVLGEFQGSIDLGDGARASAGGRDIFLAQFNANGSVRWSRAIGGAGDEYAFDVVVDSNDEPVVVGGDFISKFDAGGVLRWSQPAGYPRRNVLAVGSKDDVLRLEGNDVVRCDSDGRPISRNALAPWPFLPATIASDSEGDVAVGSNVYTGEIDAGDTYAVSLSKVGLGEPFVVSLADVPGDQGRALTMQLRRSRFDAQIAPTVVRYDIYLRDDPLPAGIGRSDLPDSRNLGASAPPGQWIYIASQSADQSEAYDNVVPSLADATIARGLHSSVYFVRAATADPAYFFDSEVVAGYSLDNLAPAAPSNVVFANPALTWQGGTEADFDYFVVYGSQSPVFGMDAVQIAQTSQPFFDIFPSQYAYYHVAAVDFAGNEGAAGSGLGEDTAPPSAPGNLQYAAAVLSWEAAPEPDVDYYAIYGSLFATFDGRVVRLDSTTQLTLDVSAWHYPFYFVTTFDFADNESLAAMVGESDPPPAPTNVQFDGRIVSWDASTDPGAVEYAVYGSMSGNFGDPKTELGRPTATSLEVIAYSYAYFFVTVVDWNDNESEPTRVTDVVAPSTVVNLTYRSGTIVWAAPPQADISNYTIYGSQYDTFDQPKTMILETTGTSYYAAGDGFLYHYVTASDLWGNEGPPARVDTPAPVFTFAITAFPNPFNPETTIRYEVPRSGNVTVAVYDARGALVATLVDASQDAGSYDVPWHGTDAAGDPVGSGVYFARIDFSGDTKSRKLVLLK